jgi:hypothetical protein
MGSLLAKTHLTVIGEPGYSFLILASIHGMEDEYKRVGIGNVNHGWFDNATTKTNYIV